MILFSDLPRIPYDIVVVSNVQGKGNSADIFFQVNLKGGVNQHSLFDSPLRINFGYVEWGQVWRTELGKVVKYATSQTNRMDRA